MAWFKVDDGLHSSRKLMSIPRRGRYAAIGVWTVAGSWSADELTDGHIPNYMLESWGTPPSAPEALVAAGLWERTSDGYLFCNWHEYQPSKQDVDAERAASRERMRELRARRKQKKPRDHAEDAEAFGRTAPNSSESVRNPDPTRPDPVTTTSNEVVEARRRAARIPDAFMVTAEMREWAAREVPGLDVDDSTSRFVDYWRAESGTKARKLDWVSTWRNWLRRDADRASTRLTPSQRAQKTAAAGRNVAGTQITTLEIEG